MTDIKAENKAFYRASIFLHSLYHAGVNHVVISPGSRSTPLTMAAAALPDIETHIILDERSAAYFALGIGKAANRPAALICTSGTAVANYYPAVIEARMSGVPLILLTADRPPHLRTTGANQAIDQINIFGKYPVFFKDVGEPKAGEEKLNEISEIAGKAVYKAITDQGPAHLNFSFCKPFEPDPSFVASIREKRESLTPVSFVEPKENLKHTLPFENHILEVINSSVKPLIVSGQLAASSEPEALPQLARQLNAPILTENGIIDTTHTVRGFEGFLRNSAARAKLKPDLILRFGRQPASKSVLQAIKYWNPDRHIYFSDSDQQVDISETTSAFIKWNGHPFETENINSRNEDWLDKWKNAEASYFEKSEKIIQNTTSLTDGHVYHHLVPQIPQDWSVFISNSFPARDRSMFGRWKSRHTYTNRGASGIDGITSTAMGVCQANKKPGILFTGDLAFLHDTNALLNAKKVTQPLVVVVINNNGGSIFRMLPIAEHTQYFTPYFETPQEADITALAKSYGIDTKRIQKIEEIRDFDIKEWISKSSSNLVVIECCTDPDASMELRNQLWNLQV